MIYIKLYEELMGVGRTEIIPEAGIIVASFPERSWDAYKIYDAERISKYSEEEIISLFKGLVIAEKKLSWHCGSTSPAAHVYQIISSKQLDPDYQIADWAFQLSDNEYVPFGFIRHGEKTAYEYINWRNKYDNRIIQEKLDAEERKRQKYNRSIEIKKKKKALDEKNKLEYERITQMLPIEQVTFILNDATHNFLYFTPVICRLLDRNDLTAEVLKPILIRLSNLPKTPFNRKLLKHIENKIKELKD